MKVFINRNNVDVNTVCKLVGLTKACVGPKCLFLSVELFECVCVLSGDLFSINCEELSFCVGFSLLQAAYLVI